MTDPRILASLLAKEELLPEFVVHAYVPIGVPKWRTCAVCGRGANAEIHKAAKSSA